MSNTLQTLNASYWTKVMQEVRYKELVAMAIANVDLKPLLKNGETVHKPYRSQVRGQSYSKGTAFTVQDISSTDDTLTVNTFRVVPFYLDDVDAIQNSYQTADEFAADCMDRLNRFVDADVLSEYPNATSTVKDADVGGASPDGVQLSVSNVNKVFTAAGRKLDLLNVKQDQRFAVISPSVLEIIRQYLAGKDTQFGEEVGMNGKVGSRFGFEIYLSNNLTYTANWTPANNPSNNDTITIAGITFTFVAAIGATPGNVLIGGNLNATLTNLVGLLNNPGTTSASQVALSADNQAKIEGLTATNNTTYISIVFKGGSEVALTASDVADVWGVEVLHCLFGKKKAVNLVMQKTPSIEFKDVPDKLGKNIVPWMIYGKKTFNNDKDLLVDVQIDGSRL